MQRMMRDRPAPVAALLAGAISLLVFSGTLVNGFVNLDDPLYVIDNPLIRSVDASSLIRMFTETHAGFWMPLTWLSFAVDYHFWILNPFGYHLTNILLHAVNTGLVVLIADRVMRQGQGSRTRTAGLKVKGKGEEYKDEGQGARVKGKGEEYKDEGQGARTRTAGLKVRGQGEEGRKWLYPGTLLLVGLLWGIHPLRVESVAWVTERKDVLNGLFALSSVLAYFRYATRRETGEYHKPAYLLSLMLFACSLMAKPVTVVLPVLLLMFDYYPLVRLRRHGVAPLLWEKIPFLVISAIVVVMTLTSADGYGMLASVDSLTPVQRVMVSGAAVFEYLRLMVLPTGVMPLHIIDPAEMTTYGFKATVVVFSAAGIFAWCRRPAVFTAVLCFILLLLPVLAFFQNGLQSHAARFTYLPAVAPTILACSLLGMLFRRAGMRDTTRVVLASAALVALAGYAASASRQIAVWKDTDAVWSRIIELKPNGRAYKERGLFLLSTGNHSAAADDLKRALEYARRADLPELFNLHAFRGEALRLQEKPAEAVEEFSRAIDLCARSEYFYRRGLAFDVLGRAAAAGDDFRRSGGYDTGLKWLTRNECE